MTMNGAQERSETVSKIGQGQGGGLCCAIHIHIWETDRRPVRASVTRYGGAKPWGRGRCGGLRANGAWRKRAIGSRASASWDEAAVPRGHRSRAAGRGRGGDALRGRARQPTVAPGWTEGALPGRDATDMTRAVGRDRIGCSTAPATPSLAARHCPRIRTHSPAPTRRPPPPIGHRTPPPKPFFVHLLAR